MNFVRILETKQYIKFCKTGTKLKDLYRNLSRSLSRTKRLIYRNPVLDRLAEQKTFIVDRLAEHILPFNNM